MNGCFWQYEKEDKSKPEEQSKLRSLSLISVPLLEIEHAKKESADHPEG